MENEKRTGLRPEEELRQDVQLGEKQEAGLDFEVRQETDLTASAASHPAVPDPQRAEKARQHFQSMVSKYKKRQRDTLVDTVTAGLSYADEVAVDLGLMEDTGLLGETLDVVTSALPFAVIAVTEQAKVIMGKKTQKAALENTFYRFVKTGAAMGAGALAGTVGGLGAAIPAALGVRALLDQHKSKALLGNRIVGRTQRLAALKEKMHARRAYGVPHPDGQEKEKEQS